MPRAPKPFELPPIQPHPRYGAAPTRSGLGLDADELCAGFWRYAQGHVLDARLRLVRQPSGAVAPRSTFYLFLASAIAADTARQRYGVFPRRHYVDILRRCVRCGTWFLFFAREQRHWYETLGFWIDADCVHCLDCRKADQRTRRASARYAERIVRLTELGLRELTTLLRDALLLADAGLLKDRHKLARLRRVGRDHGVPEALTLALSALLDGPDSTGSRPKGTP